ncbi:MAG: hypothetical protein EA382_01575 [Spirochaetaceae bacterium]|nr:MAG: hypothetical protein EA382_01575 [Spirochaetaceae bacterium]
MVQALIPKGIATPRLIAHIVIFEFEDVLPLYRHEEPFARKGMDLRRQTMADWMIAVAAAANPVLAAVKRRLRGGPAVPVDETPSRKACDLYTRQGTRGSPDAYCRSAPMSRRSASVATAAVTSEITAPEIDSENRDDDSPDFSQVI